MIKMNDIYIKVGSRLYTKKFHDRGIEDKKLLLDQELKNYLICKIGELENQNFLINTDNNIEKVSDLIELLGELIPESNHQETITQVTHYVINIASEMQGRYIVWHVDNKETVPSNPITKFDEDGYWDSITTHINESDITSFKFVYDIFTNHFMTKEKVKMKTIKRLEDNV